jgi:hypothetical protein
MSGGPFSGALSLQSAYHLGEIGEGAVSEDRIFRLYSFCLPFFRLRFLLELAVLGHKKSCL